MLEAYTKEIHPQGESLPIVTRVYRVQVVTASMRAGVLLAKIDSFRNIFEEHGHSLTSSQHVCDTTTFILKEVKSRIIKKKGGICDI